MGAATTRRWSRLTFAVAVATGLLLAFIPTASTETCEETSTGGSICSSGTASLVESEGISILLILAVPALLTVGPVFVESRRAALAAAIGLSLLTILAMASIGVLLIPTLVLAWISVRSHVREGLSERLQ